MTVRLTHPDVGAPYYAADSTVPYWVARGWVIDPDSVPTIPGSTPVTHDELTEGVRDAVARGAAGPAVAGLSARAGRATRVVTIGSSTTEGYFAPTLDTRWSSLLARDLRATFPTPDAPGGIWCPAVSGASWGSTEPEWVETGTITTVAQGLALQSRSLAAGATMTRARESCTGWTVLYGQGPSAAAFTVSIDGAAPVTVTPDTTGVVRSDGSWSSTPLPRGFHTIKITASGSSAVIEGAYAHDGDRVSGIQMLSSGRASQPVSAFTASTSWLSRIGQLDPDLVLILPGATEFGAQTAAATFQADLAALVNAVQAAGSPAPQIVILGTYPRQDVASPTVPWAAYLAAMDAVAAADTGVSFYDLAPAFAAAGIPGADPHDLLATDLIHLTSRGVVFLRDAIRRSLGLAAAAVDTKTWPPSNAIVHDSFDRADSTSGLGTADSGHPWTTVAGTWGITSGRAVASAPAIGVVDVGTADVDITGTVTIGGTFNGTGISLRTIDTSNRLLVYLSALNTLSLVKLVGGSLTTLVNASVSYATGDTLTMRVVAKGDVINVWADGVLRIQHVLSTSDQTLFGAVNRHGLRETGSAAWDRFTIVGDAKRTATPRLIPPLRTGLYFFPQSPQNSATSNTLGNGTLRLAPWLVERAITIDRLGAEITTIGEAGSKLRLGIYADDGSGYPGALLLDAGQIAADSSTVPQELTCSLTLQPGLYWLGAAVQSAAATQPTVRTVANGWTPPIPVGTTSIPGANVFYLAYQQTSVTGALPATFSSTVSVGGTLPRLLIRTA